MGKQLIPHEITKLSDYAGLMKELSGESDRAAAIVAANYLHVRLGQLIAAFLVDDGRWVNKLLNLDGSDLNSPAGSFYAQIVLAYNLGLIGREMRDDLNVIREIRNAFAHSLHGARFDDPKVSAACGRLKLLTRILSFPPPWPQKPPRRAYVESAVVIGYFLKNLTKGLDKRREVAGDVTVAFEELPDSSEAGKAQ